MALPPTIEVITMKNHRKKRSPIDAFIALSDAEKERVVAEFDEEFVMDTFRPVTPSPHSSRILDDVRRAIVNGASAR